MSKSPKGIAQHRKANIGSTGRDVDVPKRELVAEKVIEALKSPERLGSLELATVMWLH